jgi:nitroreductase
VTDLDIATVDRLLTTTRAVRKRLDPTRPVPEATITECLRIAVQAPSAADSQTWRWLVLTTPEVTEAVGEIFRRASEPVRGLLAEATDDAARRRLASSLYLVDHLHEMPALVLACVVDEEVDGQRLPPLGHYGSVYPAIWSFQLALRSRGLGSTLMLLPDPQAIVELLGLPGNVEPVSLVPVAYYTGDTFKPAKRRPVEEVTYWNRWGDTRPAG